MPNGQYAVQQVAAAGAAQAPQLGQQQGSALTLQLMQVALQANMQPAPEAQQLQQQQRQQQQQTHGFTCSSCPRSRARSWRSKS